MSVKLSVAVSLGDAERLAIAKFGSDVRFTSERALRAMGTILKLGLLPAFVAQPTQIMTPGNVSEDEQIAQPDADDYWSILDLWRAWQLSQVTAPKPARDVWVAVVDQGFWNPPQVPDDPAPGIFWDSFRASDGTIGEQGDSTHAPWHGSNCASALNAVVNDGWGAAGAALRGTRSKVATLGAGRVRTLAVEMPAGSLTTFDAVAFGIQDAVQSGVDIVSVSYALKCGPACNKSYAGKKVDKVVLDALAFARENSVLVLFAAGNDNLSLDDADRNYVGCESADALCVGGVFRDKNRWTDWPNSSAGSNFGQAVRIWGPGHRVWVNPDGGNAYSHYVDGTSLATPFVAGVLALTQVSSGKDFTPQTVQAQLTPPALTDASAKPVILNAYEFMRAFATVAPDAFEGKPPTMLPGPMDLMTIDKPDRKDEFEIKATACESISVDVDYLRDDTRGSLRLALRPSGGNRVVASVPPMPNATLSLTASACSGRSFVEVYQEGIPTTGKKLTTGYSINIRREPMACEAKCPNGKGVISEVPATKTNPTLPPDQCPAGIRKKGCPEVKTPTGPGD